MSELSTWKVGRKWVASATVKSEDGGHIPFEASALTEAGAKRKVRRQLNAYARSGECRR